MSSRSNGGMRSSSTVHVTSEVEDHMNDRGVQENEVQAPTSSQRPYNPDGELQYRSCDSMGCDGPRGKGRVGCTVNPTNYAPHEAQEREDLEQVMRYVFVAFTSTIRSSL